MHQKLETTSVYWTVVPADSQKIEVDYIYGYFEIVWVQIGQPLGKNAVK